MQLTVTRSLAACAFNPNATFSRRLPVLVAERATKRKEADDLSPTDRRPRKAREGCTGTAAAARAAWLVGMTRTTQSEKRHEIGSRARPAFALLLYTAQRRSDVVRMGWQHVQGEAAAVRQDKTGAALLIPIHLEGDRRWHRCRERT